MLANRRNVGGAVDDPDADRVSPEHTCVDVVVCPGAEVRVESGDEVGNRLDARRVLQLGETDDVGVELGDRGEELVPLSRSSSSAVSAPRHSCLLPTGPHAGVAPTSSVRK